MPDASDGATCWRVGLPYVTHAHGPALTTDPQGDGWCRNCLLDSERPRPLFEMFVDWGDASVTEHEGWAEWGNKVRVLLADAQVQVDQGQR